MGNTFEFDAFISYSHRDLNWGKWLQKKLENWHIPAEFRKNMSDTRKRMKIFRDQTDLAGVELRDSIQRELRASRYLVVICSPNSAVSPWVAAEISYFKELGREENIIPFIVDGEPETDREELECYSPELRNVEDRHFLGANVQELGKNKAFLKTVSILLDIRFNRLVDRDRQMRWRRALIIGSSSAIIVIVTVSLLWQNFQLKERNQQLSYEMYGAAIVSFAESDTIDATGIEALKVSAQAGNPKSCMMLADCCKHGKGTDADPEKAFYWYSKAAELGDSGGMISLSDCYRNGIGTEPDEEKAFEWDMRAAEAGQAEGMLNVAFCYEDGHGVPVDLDKAFEWYDRAAQQGLELAVYNLARCYMKGIGTEADQEKTFYWTGKLAEAGNPIGMYNLGIMLQNGYGTKEDAEKALYWYQKSAEAGNADAMFMVGWCIENSYGTSDPALDWYKRAAEAGDEEAVEAVARITSSELQ